MVYTVNTIVTSENAAEVLAPILTRILNVGAEGGGESGGEGSGRQSRVSTHVRLGIVSRETHRRLSLSRRGLTGVALEVGGRRSEHLEETRTESKSYRGCARRGVSFLFSSRFSRYVIGRLKFPPSWKTRAKTSSFYRVGETLLARVKLDNFSFQHCKLFATSSLGGGYLPSSTTLGLSRFDLFLSSFRFLRFFQNLVVALCVFLDFYLLHVRIYNYIFSSLVDEKSSRGWQTSRTKSFKPRR